MNTNTILILLAILVSIQTLFLWHFATQIINMLDFIAWIVDGAPTTEEEIQQKKDRLK